MNRISIGSDNGLSPIRRQAIIQTNAGLMSTGPLGTNLSEIVIKIPNFIQENASENIVCEMAAILSRGSIVKELSNNVTYEMIVDSLTWA